MPRHVGLWPQNLKDQQLWAYVNEAACSCKLFPRLSKRRISLSLSGSITYCGITLSSTHKRAKKLEGQPYFALCSSVTPLYKHNAVGLTTEVATAHWSVRDCHGSISAVIYSKNATLTGQVTQKSATKFKVSAAKPFLFCSITGQCKWILMPFQLYPISPVCTEIVCLRTTACLQQHGL